MAAHVLQAFLFQGHCNTLIPLPSLRCSQFCVEISNHQQHIPPELLADGHYDILYG